ncbi:NAD-dependent formate dehydrogenase catalytic subunit [Acetitomaculum ruminis DSM 5522]|uniref:NAD-dependent formate dehydrogenase catalytic subunit n=1 Tax=Acetitomaculum ruminis DSM 5522 TaxID=1120918 RepID=A0A1I0UYA9_9FIRM|nr:formate dehydrogenase subunit alpha [Acetitomaculum ruminis]SFA69038.1 NAD-dependent formate dehydrogenase catalytic subunit [Acetitomaculum ruminis DSM 5522]
MINVTIDGKAVEVEEGTTILQAAEKVGVKIPTLCYIKELDPEASCRMCMVEIEGMPKLVTACSFPCADGNVIYTKSDRVIEARRGVLDLMLSNHPQKCFSCVKNGECKFQDLCYEYGIKETTLPGEMIEKPIDDTNPFFTFNPNLCILCHRCVNTCQKITGRGAIGTSQRGFRSVISTPFGTDWYDSNCESCGNCVQACPTGALVMKRREHYRPWEVKKVLTTCPHCATGCRYYLVVKDNKIVDVEAAEGASNRGLVCVKGRSGSFDFVHSGDRVKYPLIKNKETGKFERATWDEALDLVASKFMEIKKKYGSNALAGFACSRSPNEDIYMMQKLVRCCFGTNNVDNCARVCHSASVAGLAMTLGSGAMTNTIYDITHDVDVIMLVGSNPEEAHPVVGMQIRQAVQKGTKLIVVDPRDIDLAKHADIHLKLRPGTNVAFANGIMNVIISEGLVDKKFVEERTEGYEKLAEICKDYTPEKVAEICHLNADDIRKAALMYAKAEKAPIIYCLGVTEHSTGTEGVMSMSNIAMMVGKLGKEGCGVNPLRGQNNVQGACDMGALPTDFPGYQKIKTEGVVEKFEKAWNTQLSHEVGMTATEVFPAAIEGKVKGLYIYGEDPIVTDPDTHHVIKALTSLDFFVMNELFITETAQYADVILPGVSYAEKEGTFSNTERRVQRVRKAVELEGEMRLDTDIFIDLMNRMGYPQPHLTSAEIMDEIASLTPSFTGISHARLDALDEEEIKKSIQWPCPEKDHPGTPIMHVGKFTRGLGWFYPAEYIPSQEQPDDDYPIILMTGRILYHYTTRAMTGRTPGLMQIAGHSFIEMNTKDAEKLGVKNGDKVKVSSRRGEIQSTARVSDKVSPGESWMPFHFPDGNANWLTNAALDKYARIPEYKVCAIKIEKA